MKIAICLSGHMRMYKRLKPNFDRFCSKLLSTGEVDIFVATWDRQNAAGGTWSGNFNHLDSSHTEVVINAEEIKKFYNAKDVIVHDELFYSSIHSPLRADLITRSYERVFENNMQSYNGIPNGYRQFFIMHQSNILKKKYEHSNNFIYDKVFRVRPDFFFDISYLEQFEFSVKPNKAYSFSPGPELDDQFYYGDSITIDKVMSIYLRAACLIENGLEPATAFNNLTKAYHDIEGIRLPGRLGVLPNDPMPEGVEYGDTIHSIATHTWFR